MTDVEILKEYVRKVVKCDENWLDGFMANYIGKYTGQLIGERYYEIIFDHENAKKFWGRKKTKIHKYDLEKKSFRAEEIWEVNLKIMVLEKNKLRYIEKFLDKK
jgi:hypothetical protein